MHSRRCGFLTGAIRRIEDLAEDDWRRTNPRFQGENFDKNLALVDAVHELADEKQCSAAQLALAWLLAREEGIVPIPGTRSIQRLEENAAAVALELTDAEIERLDGIAPQGIAAGLRYPEASMSGVNL